MNTIDVLGFNNAILMKIQIMNIKNKTYAKITTVENNNPHSIFSLYFYIKVTKGFKTLYKNTIYGSIPIYNSEKYIRIYNNTVFKLYHTESISRLNVYDKNNNILSPLNIVYIWNMNSLKIINYEIITTNDLYNAFLCILLIIFLFLIFGV